MEIIEKKRFTDYLPVFLTALVYLAVISGITTLLASNILTGFVPFAIFFLLVLIASPWVAHRIIRSQISNQGMWLFYLVTTAVYDILCVTIFVLWLATAEVNSIFSSIVLLIVVAQVFMGALVYINISHLVIIVCYSIYSFRNYVANRKAIAEPPTIEEVPLSGEN